MKTPEFVIFDVHGGIGKHIAATAVVRNIKAAYLDSKLVVVAAWPRVFLNHPDIYRVYSNGNLQYFHDDFIRGHDFLFLKSEPYHHTDFIAKRRHLIDVWSEQCGVPTVQSTPNLTLTARETLYLANKYASNRPLLLLQTSGGTGQPYPYSWVRDCPPTLAHKIVKTLANDFTILHVRRKDQPGLENTTAVVLDDVRELIGLINIAQTRLLIDSYAQHASAALGVKSVVLWPVDNTKILGYESNHNIVAEVPKEHQRPYAYIEEYRMEGQLESCPYANSDIFDIKTVLEAVMGSTKQKDPPPECLATSNPDKPTDAQDIADRTP